MALETLLVLEVILWVMLFFALKYQDYTITALAGIMFMVLGVDVMINGIPDFSDLLRTAFSLVNIGVGAYVTIRGGYEVYKDKL